MRVALFVKSRSYSPSRQLAISDLSLNCLGNPWASWFLRPAEASNQRPGFPSWEFTKSGWVIPTLSLWVFHGSWWTSNGRWARQALVHVFATNCRWATHRHSKLQRPHDFAACLGHSAQPSLLKPKLLLDELEKMFDLGVDVILFRFWQMYNLKSASLFCWLAFSGLTTTCTYVVVSSSLDPRWCSASHLRPNLSLWSSSTCKC